MRARPQIRERLLCSKLRRWARIGSSPHIYSNSSVFAARRNYSRLGGIGFVLVPRTCSAVKVGDNSGHESGRRQPGHRSRARG